MKINRKSQEKIREEAERHNSMIDGSELFEDDVEMESTAFPIDPNFIQWLASSNSPPAAVRHFRHPNHQSMQHEIYGNGSI
jgi:hypothetical protein